MFSERCPFGSVHIVAAIVQPNSAKALEKMSQRRYSQDNEPTARCNEVLSWSPNDYGVHRSAESIPDKIWRDKNSGFSLRPGVKGNN